MDMTMNQLKELSNKISYLMYAGKIQETKELAEIMEKLSAKLLETVKQYTDFYWMHMYTFESFSELVEDEKRQTEGMTLEECKRAIGYTIFELSCGWVVQYV